MCGGHNSLWKDTLVELCYDETVREYYEQHKDSYVDMDLVFEAVEKRIGAPLPEAVKIASRSAYSIRKEEMAKVIEREDKVQAKGGPDFDVGAMLASMIGNRPGVGTSQVRTASTFLDRDVQRGIESNTAQIGKNKKLEEHDNK